MSRVFNSIHAISMLENLHWFCFKHSVSQFTCRVPRQAPHCGVLLKTVDVGKVTVFFHVIFLKTHFLMGALALGLRINNMQIFLENLHH